MRIRKKEPRLLPCRIIFSGRLPRTARPREGKDEQEVLVRWDYRWSEGTKTLVRTDTDAVVERRTITDDERQMAFEMGETKAEAQLRELMLNEKPQRQIDVEE